MGPVLNGTRMKFGLITLYRTIRWMPISVAAAKSSKTKGECITNNHEARSHLPIISVASHFQCLTA